MQEEIAMNGKLGARIKIGLIVLASLKICSPMNFAKINMIDETRTLKLTLQKIAHFKIELVFENLFVSRFSETILETAKLIPEVAERLMTRYRERIN